jgi:cyclin-dependent kinase regulatory subunit CKS1
MANNNNNNNNNNKPQQIDYSDKYQDAKYEYRHVILPKDLAKSLPRNRTLSELEWRNIGVQQSRGWENYSFHRPEPHILLFRRPLGTVRLYDKD